METLELRSADGRTYFWASLTEGHLQLENEYHYENAPGSPWIEAIYKIEPSEFPHILALFALPEDFGIAEGLKAINESGRVDELNRLLVLEQVIIAEKFTWWSFDD
jgi:hypothetical protein